MDGDRVGAPAPRMMMHLAGRSDARGLGRLGVHLVLMLAAGLLVHVAEGLWLVPAVLLLAATQAALFAPFHESSHMTAFRTRWLNAVVGWAAGVPSLHNWHFYQQFHLAHHHHTQVPGKDPELAVAPPSTLPSYVARVSALPFWRARLAWMRDAWRGDLSGYGYIHASAAPRVIRSMRAASATAVVLAVAAGLAFGWQAPLLYWVVPQLLGQAMLRLYLLTEHTGCSLDRDGLTNTRTMLTIWPMRLLMWNMPYHAEHHLYPFIPFHRLAEAHAALKGRLAHVHPGYVSWHRQFIGQLRRG